MLIVELRALNLAFIKIFVSQVVDKRIPKKNITIKNQEIYSMELGMQFGTVGNLAHTPTMKR